MKKIAVLTSGGDAPGMNAAIRAVARTALFYGIEVIGVRYGYKGLVEGDFFEMQLSTVGGIIQKGGTVLFTARSKEFTSTEGRARAINNLEEKNIDGLVVIGGDGSFKGAISIERLGVATIGIPTTIDNDILGTDYTIGYDTAVNNALDAIDKIRDTATSHERVFIIEVMGRDSGWIALRTGIAGGAESIIVPEMKPDYGAMSDRILRGLIRGKKHSIIVVAEGAATAYDVAKELRTRTELESRIMVLGHIQRGGAPSAFDRYVASKMGFTAVQYLREGKTGVMTALNRDEIVEYPLEDAVRGKKDIDINNFELAALLAT